MEAPPNARLDTETGIQRLPEGIMTLHIYRQFEQRSEDWYKARCGVVTASVVAKLVTPSTLKVARNGDSRGVTATLAAERITGNVDPTFQSADMARGVDHEPFARDAYAENYAPVEEVGFVTEDKWGFTIGYSPDGLVGDDGLIEIKCPRQKGHLQTILDDAVPSFYMAQLQTALLVSGRPWIDYVSFCAGMPLWTKRVEPDPKWQEAIVDAVDRFEAEAALIVTAYETAIEGLPPTERIPDFGEIVI